MRPIYEHACIQYTTQVIYMGFVLKQFPNQRWLWLPLTTLVTGLMIVSFEVWSLYLFARNEWPGLRKWSWKIKNLRSWGMSFLIHIRMMCCLCSTVGCVLYLHRRVGDDAADDVELRENWRDDAPMWLLFSFSTYMQARVLISMLFVSPNFQKLGIQAITIDRM